MRCLSGSVIRLIGIFGGLLAGLLNGWLMGRSSVKQENIETCLHQDQVTKLHLEGSQLVCEEGCHLAEPLLELHCNVEGWNQAGSVVEVACDTLPGPQVATCTTCDENTGILPHTCLLLYSFSEAEDSAAKVVATNQKLAAAFMMLLLSILVFMLLSEPRRNQRVPSSFWKGRGGDEGNVEVENLKTKMRLEKEKESGGCCQEKAREMTVDIGNSDGRTAPTFLLEHSMIKERKGRKKTGKRSVDRS